MATLLAACALLLLCLGCFGRRVVAANLPALVQELSVPVELRNASGLPRYVVGSFSIGGVTQVSLSLSLSLSY